MNRKLIIVSALITFFLAGIITTPASAGSRQRGRWEGFALGFGAAVIGHTLVHHHHSYGHYRAPVDRHPPRKYRHRRHGHHRAAVDRHPPRHRYRHRHGHYKAPVDRHPPRHRYRHRYGHHRAPVDRHSPGPRHGRRHGR